MAIVTVDSSMAIVTTNSSSSSSSNHHLHLESIPVIDMRFLSQSELNSLSLCSNEAFDLHRCNDIVIPKIDRSIFNESAGSRKQTYSRIRLAPRKPDITSIGRRRRLSGLLPVPKPPIEEEVVDDPEIKENERIVNFIKKLFAKNSNSKTHQTLITKELFDLNKAAVVENLAIVMVESEERGTKRKDRADSSNENKVMEIVNRNGVVIDIAALGNMVDPFGPELERRTVGLETDAELLGFLRGLEGRWGSRRMKRKVVDASDFGDALPRGWKLLLSLKRKGGRVWVFCRRYISPNGQQFQTCKEISSYLLSVFGPQNASQPYTLNSNEHIDGVYRLESGSTAGLEHENDSRRDVQIYHSVLPLAVLPPDHEKQIADRRVENLEELEVKDLLECHKCNTTFDEKDEYLQHVLSSHPRNAKRCRLGSSVGDGVIIKDGKYECQFCHKVFNEKHSYNGHVGIHVRNYVKNFEASTRVIPMQKRLEAPSVKQAPAGVLNVDVSGDTAMGYEMNDGSAHTDLDVGSIPEHITTRANNETKVLSPQCRPNSGSIPETSVAKSNNDLNVSIPCSEPDVGGSKPQTFIARSSNEMIVGSSNCELAAGSIAENSSTGAHSETKVGSSHTKLSTGPIPEVFTAKSNCSMNAGVSYSQEDIDIGVSVPPISRKPNELTDGSPSNTHNPGDNEIHESLADESHNKQESGYEMVIDKCEKFEANSFSESEASLSNNEEISSESSDKNFSNSTCEDKPGLEEAGCKGSLLTSWGNEHIICAETSASEVLSIQLQESELENAEESGNNEVCFDNDHAGPDKNVATETVRSTDEDTLQTVTADTSAQVMQSSDCFSNLHIISEKVENDFCTIDQKLGNISNFDELRFEDVEPSQFVFVSEQESSPLPQGDMDLAAYDADLEQDLNPSIQFGSEAILPATDNRQQLTTVCVWCGVEFNIEAVNPEMQSDSVGFMCPTCKSKISMQLNVMENGLGEF